MSRVWSKGFGRFQLSSALENIRSRRILRSLGHSTEQELRDRILPFWFSLQAPDGSHSISVDSRGVVDPDAAHTLTFEARLGWTMSQAAMRYRTPVWAEAAQRASLYLGRFKDPDRLGYFSELNPSGAPSKRTKHIYGQAFALFALTASATLNEAGSLTSAFELFEQIEHHGCCTESGLYIESFDESWHETANEDRALGGAIARHTADTHLHLIEAYSDLLELTRISAVRNALSNLVQVFLNRFIRREGDFMHQKLDAEGKPIAGPTWPGHDIEASWVIDRAADLLGWDDLSTVRRTTRRLALESLRRGRFPSGGWSERVHDSGPEQCCLWWVQAEALVGLLNSGLRWRDASMIAAAAEVWNFIKDHVIDSRTGDWHLRVSPSGQPDITAPRVIFWKDSYHQTRACMMVADQCRAAAQSFSSAR